MGLARSVIDAFPSYTIRFEGRVYTMYSDIEGLITTGMGNLIDPISAALALKWRHADGGLASSDQIAADWRQIKALAMPGGKLDPAFVKHSTEVQAKIASLTLHLTSEDVDMLVLERLNYGAIDMQRRHFPALESYPADAQLALCSMMWAAGSDWPRKFPRAKQAILARDWATAAKEAVLADHTPSGVANPGVIPRNDQQRICFANAAAVEAGGLDASVLYWPAFPHAPEATNA
jgi:hypothetical protein